MREFKFRGKRISDGDWMNGDLVTVVSVCSTVKRSFIHIRLSDIGFVQDALTAQICLHEVDPKTVGQYMGLKDDSGKEIYEGDIVKSYDAGIHADPDNYILHKVHWSRFGWSPFYAKDVKWMDYYGDLREFEVIGNIYENPELLGELK